LNADWAWYKEFPTVKYQTFNPMDVNDSFVQIFFYSRYTKGMKIYPLPFYFAAQDYIELEGELANYRLNNVKGGFTPTTVITLPTANMTEEEEQALYDGLKESAVGRDGNRFIVLYGDGSNSPTITTLAGLDTNSAKELDEIVTQKILTAFGLNSPMLAGLPGAGSLGGNGSELATATAYFRNFFVAGQFSSGQTAWFFNPSGGDRFVVYQNTSNTTYFYYNSSNNYGTVSDARTKKDITGIDTSKSKQFITSITPSIYRFIDSEDSGKQLGFIAQDILACSKTEAQKNIVNNWKEYEEQNGDPYEEYEDNNDKDEDGKPKIKKRKVYLGVSQTSMIPEIIGCIQAMDKENEELKAEVELLKQKNISLEERLLKIEKLLDLQ
jgi:hypothetical protein